MRVFTVFVENLGLVVSVFVGSLELFIVLGGFVVLGIWRNLCFVYIFFYRRVYLNIMKIIFVFKRYYIEVGFGGR